MLLGIRAGHAKSFPRQHDQVFRPDSDSEKSVRIRNTGRYDHMLLFTYCTYMTPTKIDKITDKVCTPRRVMDN